MPICLKCPDINKRRHNITHAISVSACLVTGIHGKMNAFLTNGWQLDYTEREGLGCSSVPGLIFY